MEERLRKALLKDSEERLARIEMEFWLNLPYLEKMEREKTERGIPFYPEITRQKIVMEKWILSEDDLLGI